MKYLIAILLFTISFNASAQWNRNDTTKYVWYKYQYGSRMPRAQYDSVFAPPADTIFSKKGLATVGSTLYVGNGSYWIGAGAGADLSAYLRKSDTTSHLVVTDTYLRSNLVGIDSNTLVYDSANNLIKVKFRGLTNANGDSVLTIDSVSGKVKMVVKGGGGIPITGTDIASGPVTGNIKINWDTDTYIPKSIYAKSSVDSMGLKFDPDGDRMNIFRYSNDGTITSEINVDQGSMSLLTTGSGNTTTLQINPDRVYLNSNNSAFKGMQGALYYGANYDSLTYVQKKYVDDAIAASGGIPITGTDVTSGQVSGDIETLDNRTFTLKNTVGGGAVNSLIFGNAGEMNLGTTNSGVGAGNVHTDGGSAYISGSDLATYGSQIRAYPKRMFAFTDGLDTTSTAFGVGTQFPDKTLHVSGSLKLDISGKGAGKVLTSDANGVATWQTAAGGGVTTITASNGVIATGTTTVALQVDSTKYSTLFSRNKAKDSLQANIQKNVDSIASHNTRIGANTTNIATNTSSISLKLNTADTSAGSSIGYTRGFTVQKKTDSLAGLIAAKGRVDSIRLANTGVLHTTPATFSLVGQTGVITQTLATQSANKIFASPNGGSGTPNFRTIDSTDFTSGSFYTQVRAAQITTSTANQKYGEEFTGATTSTLTLANSATANTVRLFKNGIRLPASEFSVSGVTVTLTSSRISTDIFQADYNY